MTVENTVGLTEAVALLVHPVAALIEPERF